MNIKNMYNLTVEHYLNNEKETAIGKFSEELTSIMENRNITLA